MGSEEQSGGTAEPVKTMRWYSVKPGRKRVLDFWARLGPWRYGIRALAFLVGVAPAGVMFGLAWEMTSKGDLVESLLDAGLVAIAAYLFVINLLLLASGLARHHAWVLGLGIEGDAVVFEVDSGRRHRVAASNIREVRSGPAKEFHGGWAGVRDQTQVLLNEPVDGADRFCIASEIPGYPAVVARLRALVGTPILPAQIRSRAFAFSQYWFIRWYLLAALALVVPINILTLDGSAYDGGLVTHLVAIVAGATVTGLSWLAAPWVLQLEPQYLHLGYGVYAQRVPWRDITGLKETSGGVYEVRAGPRSMSLGAGGLSPFPDLIAAIAHYANLPIPDPGQETPEAPQPPA